MDKEIIQELINSRMICMDCKRKHCNCGNADWGMRIDKIKELIIGIK